MTTTERSENKKEKCSCGHGKESHLCSFRWGIHTCMECSTKKGEATSEHCSVRGMMLWELA